MKEALSAVAEFHDAFGLGIEDIPTADIGNEKIRLRFKLMEEENEEYLAAAEACNMVEIADALGDMLYILCGTLLEHGLQYKIEAVFREIHRSNMSKLDENGNPIYREDGKVMKGPNYFKPNIASVF